MKRDFIYQIPIIVPFEGDKYPKLGGYGFDIWMDGNFAIDARKMKMEERIFTKFQKDGEEIIKRFRLGKRMFREQAYQFFDNSWLLRSATVPGNACDLSFDNINDFGGHGFEGYLKGLEEAKEYCKERYVPHNVDSFKQAMTLRELWLHWADIARALVD